MYANYIRLALRNMAKNRLYATINITGLAIGLTVFLFGSMFAEYERDHDSMFENRARIFTAGSVFGPGADIGVLETDSIYTAIAPLVINEIDDIEAIARTVDQEYLVTVGEKNDSYYHRISFADKELTRIFNFKYLYGDATAIDDPGGVILSASVAEKMFGRTDVMGELMSLDHKHNLRVTAVIADIPADSHFNSNILDGDSAPRVFASLSALETIKDFKYADNWNNLSMGDLTYMLLPVGKDRQWLQEQLNASYQRHAPEDQLKFIPLLRVRPLVESNTMIWEAIGLPAIDTIRLLGLLVLLIACVNYTNLAAAQSFGRAREVGLRKTFGAGRAQLLGQFLIESFTTAFLSTVLALACLELLVPAFNEATGKAMTLNYVSIAPFLIFTMLCVGLLAGAYPAYLITRASPIDSLKNAMLKGSSGNLFRSFMIGTQFAISTFMLASVLVVYFQNQKVEEASTIFPRHNIVLLERVGAEEIKPRQETLRRQLLTLPGVEKMTYSSQVPFEQNNSANDVTREKGDDAAKFVLQRVSIGEDFLGTYDIPLVNGRTLSRSIANDVRTEDSEQLNVLINQLGIASLGFKSAEEALGKSYFGTRDEDDERPIRQFTIVGTIPDQNFKGLHNKIKPMAFVLSPDSFWTASIRVNGENLVNTLAAIESVWQEVIPDYPIQQRFLDDVFDEVYVIFKTMNRVLAGFAAVALSLALIGLFGLAAFMAQRRTQEIGIRKVLGARVDQIVRLLIWQFSVPVLWSLLVAMPLAAVASRLYLNFFADQITMLPLIIMLASVTGIITAWLIVAGHAVKIATMSPIQSLRYE